MKNLEKQLNTIRAQVKLSKSEKTAMRERVFEYMGFNPIRANMQAYQPVRIYAWMSYRAAAFALVVALVFTSGVGITYASGGALPGDPLYAVKEFSEEAKGAFMFDEEKKAKWAIERTYRRLEEARELADKGRLNDDAFAIVETKLEKHFTHAEEKIENIREEKAAVASALKTVLASGVEAYAETLEEDEHVVQKKGVGKEVDEMSHRSRIASLARAYAHARARTLSANDVSMDSSISASVEASLSEQDAELATMAAVRAETTATTSPEVTEELTRLLDEQRAELENRSRRLPSEARERLRNALEHVENTRAQITGDIQRGSFESAQEKLLGALKETQKIKAAVQLGHDFSNVSRKDDESDENENEHEDDEEDEGGNRKNGEDDDHKQNGDSESKPSIPADILL
jgi:hypothetical protein